MEKNRIKQTENEPKKGKAGLFAFPFSFIDFQIATSNLKAFIDEKKC